MFDKMRILTGCDGSVQSKKALAEAISIAKRFSGFVKVISAYDRGGENKATVYIEEAKQLLEKEGVKYDLLLIQSVNPAKTLQTIAKQENFDLIVVGSRGLGNRVSILLGSVSKKVVADAYCNVLVVKK